MNRDGKVDMWKFYTIKQGLEQDAPPEYVLIRKELDLNFDGRVDRIMYYDAKETLALEEIDSIRVVLPEPLPPNIATFLISDAR